MNDIDGMIDESDERKKEMKRRMQEGTEPLVINEALSAASHGADEYLKHALDIEKLSSETKPQVDSTALDTQVERLDTKQR